MSTEVITTDPAASMAPAVKMCHVRALTGTLKQVSRWITRKELAAELGDSTPAFERKLRAVASVAAPVVVSYPGSPGYKHFDAASDQEIEHCIAAFRASASDQTRRANLYQNALNRRRKMAGPVAVQAELFALD